jgi:hypothetical protein
MVLGKRIARKFFPSALFGLSVRISAVVCIGRRGMSQFKKGQMNLLERILPGYLEGEAARSACTPKTWRRFNAGGALEGSEKSDAARAEAG